MRTKVIISGRVQGVFFRAHTKKKAEELGLNGWVRNLNRGEVEAVFKGPKDRVDQMIKWCWQGSPGSKVTLVKPIKPVKTEEKLSGFEIRY